MSTPELQPLVWMTPVGEISAHGAFFALAFLAAATFFASSLSSNKVTGYPDALEHGVWIVVLALLGARLGYLVSYQGVWQSLPQFFRIWEGGLVSFWGIGVGLLVAAWRSRRYGLRDRQRFWRSVALAGLLGWSIGRLGNWFGADSYGVVAASWEQVGGRVPIQLFESAACLVLFALAYRSREAAWVAVLGYLALRAIIDTWRDEALVGPLHASQWVALAGLIVGTVAYVYQYRRRLTA